MQSNQLGRIFAGVLELDITVWEPAEIQPKVALSRQASELMYEAVQSKSIGSCAKA
jgi:hypothetical protein